MEVGVAETWLWLEVVDSEGRGRLEVAEFELAGVTDGLRLWLSVLEEPAEAEDTSIGIGVTSVGVTVTSVCVIGIGRGGDEVDMDTGDDNGVEADGSVEDGVKDDGVEKDSVGEDSVRGNSVERVL